MDEYIENTIKDLVRQRDELIYDLVLKLLVERTTGENYIEIIDALRHHKEASELDRAFYINEISLLGFKGLEQIIKKELKTAEDVDVVELYEEALRNVRN